MSVPQADLAIAKFTDPDVTAEGLRRASVTLGSLRTLWFNTGTLCNIECSNCYIESGPKNDRLVYISAAEVAAYLDEIESRRLGTREIGFTGGEPFMNPQMNAILELTLGRGFAVLVLTNAMQPLLRKHVRAGLSELRRRYGGQLCLRVSLDHYTQAKHERERGAHSWHKTLQGLDWLSANGFKLHVAGRTLWQEDETSLRSGFARLFRQRGLNLDAHDPASLVLFPEMDETAPVPEISVDCWDILKRSPDEMMCASSRMVVKRKGAGRPVVLPCTLLPYDRRFELGETLAESATEVKLNHPHCAKFCVLGGASCS